jgi:hypothetical protein
MERVQYVILNEGGLKVAENCFLAAGIIALIGLLAAGALLGMAGGADILAILILPIVLVVLDIVIAIFGLKFNNDGSKAMVFIILAIILIAVQVVSMVLSPAAWTSFIGLILPVLMLIGGFLNKSAAAKQVAN